LQSGGDLRCDTVSATWRGGVREGRFCSHLINISFGTVRAYHYMTNEAAHSIDEGQPKRNVISIGRIHVRIYE